MILPDEHVPSKLKPQTTTRDQEGYAVALPAGQVFAILDGPFFGVMHALEVVPGHQTAVIVRLTKDGSDTVLYRWTQERDGGPPKWKKVKGVT